MLQREKWNAAIEAELFLSRSRNFKALKQSLRLTLLEYFTKTFLSVIDFPTEILNGSKNYSNRNKTGQRNDNAKSNILLSHIILDNMKKASIIYLEGI